MSPLVTKSIIIACAKTPNTTTVTGCKRNTFLTFYYIVIMSSAGECAASATSAQVGPSPRTPLLQPPERHRHQEHCHNQPQHGPPNQWQRKEGVVAQRRGEYITRRMTRAIAHLSRAKWRERAVQAGRPGPRAHAAARLVAAMAVMATYANPKLTKQILKVLYPLS